FWGGPPARWTDSDLRVRQPLVDLIDKGSEFVVRAELPGVAKEDVDLTVTADRSEEHTSELQSRFDLVCRLLLEKKKKSSPRGPKQTYRRAPSQSCVSEARLPPSCRPPCSRTSRPRLPLRPVRPGPLRCTRSPAC